MTTTISEVEPGGTVRYDEMGQPITDLATCGTCGRTWDDAIITSRTPVPSGRCPFEYDHEEEESPDFWQLLEDPPAGCTDVADLFHWSTNYDSGRGPAALFIDLIGWSDENLGQTVYDLTNAQGTLGYLELDKLADALKEYANNPRTVSAYVDALMEADGR